MVLVWLVVNWENKLILIWSIVNANTKGRVMPQENTSINIQLNIWPRSLLEDEQVSIQVVGLDPHQRVTLAALLTAEDGTMFVSHGHYQAGEDRGVDVTDMASVGGSYTGNTL